MSNFEDAVIQRIKQLEREVERLQKWERAADLGLGKLSDPNADRVLFWDDSAGTLKWLTVSTGLALSDTSLALSHLGLQSLTDPNADRVLFWDDSAGALKWLTVEGIVGTDLGKWQSYTPTVTAAYGTITSCSASGVYCKIGKIVHYNFRITITNNGTGSGAVIATLPVTMTGNAIGAGRDNTQSGNMLQLYATGTEIRIFDYKNSYPAVNNSILVCSITYQAA